MSTRKDTLRRQLDTILEELNRLESRAEEPPTGSVIRFNMQFGGHGTVYEYAAIRCSNGLWYTTGPSSPKGYAWESLLDWMEDGTDAFQLLRPPVRSQMTEITR